MKVFTQRHSWQHLVSSSEHQRGLVQVGDLAAERTNKPPNSPIMGEQLLNATAAQAPRPVHFITDSNPGSDLIGEVVSAFAATSLVFQDINNDLSVKLIGRARFLYEWMTEPLQTRTKYSDTNPDFNATYPSATPFAHMMLAAAWMNRRTREEQYAQQALQFHGKARGLQVQRARRFLVAVGHVLGVISVRTCILASKRDVPERVAVGAHDARSGGATPRLLVTPSSRSNAET